jgi:hypothetical protein
MSTSSDELTGVHMTASHDEPMPRACRKLTTNQITLALLLSVRLGYVLTNIVLIPLVHHLDY